MYHGKLRPTTIYEMHIFKDVENTSWTRPQIYTFQLSNGAASPFIRPNGPKGGLVNLRRCTPAQLSFLQSHLSSQNMVLKAAREAEKKAQKAKELHQKEEAKKQEEKRLEEIKKWQAEMEEKMAKQSQERKVAGEAEGESKENNSGDDAETVENICRGPTPQFPAPRYIRVPPRPQAARVYDPEPFYPAPPPPPPMFNRYPPEAYPVSPVIHNRRLPPPPPPQPYIIRERREMHTPLERESDWTLESVELDLIPVVAKLKVKEPVASSQEHRPAAYRQDYSYQTRRRPQKYPMLSYELSDSAKVEFAVVYSRTVMTAVPVAPEDHRRQDVYYASDYEDSLYEFESDDQDEVAEKEEGADEVAEVKENEDKEDEEDLEIVEGFRHCHPITESMSRCCLEKEC